MGNFGSASSHRGLPARMAANDAWASFKLAAANDRFQGMEQLLLQRSRARADVEDNEIMKIREEVTRLEATLNSEAKRREEADKALRAMFSAQMDTVEDKLK